MAAATAAGCSAPSEVAGASPAVESAPVAAPAVAPPPAADAAPGAVDTEEIRRLFATRGGSYAKTREFVRAFARSDWDAFDAPTDAELLRAGLSMTGGDALDAGDGPLAVLALDRLARSLPDDERRRLKVRSLSLACALAGDTDRALRMLDDAVSTLTDDTRGWALLHRGDVRALTRDTAGAKSDWAAALEFPYAEGEAEGPVDDVRRAAFVRWRFVGTPAPRLEDAEWIGGGPESSESLRGRVAVVHVMETECKSCRVTADVLGRIARQRDDLAVFALTFPLRRGFLPAPGGNPFWEGEPVDAIPAGGHSAHLAEFRARLGDAPPIGVLPAGKWAYWRGPGDHPLHVVDRSGRIVFSQGATRPLAMVQAFAHRALAAPSGAPR